MNLTQRFFQEARSNKDKAFRQMFLDSIDLTDTPIKRLIYEDNMLYFIKPSAFAEPIVDPLIGFKKERKTKIRVSPEAFICEYIIAIDDLLSSIIDHEGKHAEQFSDPSLALKHLVLEALPYQKPFEKLALKLEEEAYSYQMQKFPDRNISERFCNFINSTYNMMLLAYPRLFKQSN